MVRTCRVHAYTCLCRHILTNRVRVGSTTGEDTSAVAAPSYWAGMQSERFYECPMPQACLGGARGSGSTPSAAGGGGGSSSSNTTAAVCAPGYTGILCAICEDGYFLQFGECARCPDTRTGAYVVVAAFVVGVVVVAAVSACAVKRWGYAFLHIRGPVAVCLSFAQILASAATIYNMCVAGWRLSVGCMVHNSILATLSLTVAVCVCAWVCVACVAVWCLCLVSVFGVCVWCLWLFVCVCVCVCVWLCVWLWLCH